MHMEFKAGERLHLYIGSLIGLAVGDALGTTLEFMPPLTFAPITDIVGGGPFHLQAGQWTDDTAMALCLAESLIKYSGFHAKDQMDRYVKWYKQGYMSSTGICFDIGDTNREALELYIKTGNPFCGNKTSESSGNGSLMRLAPVPLYFASKPKLAMQYCEKSSLTTHGSRECLDACKFFGGLLLGALRKTNKETLLSPFYHPIHKYWESHSLTNDIAAIAAGCYKHQSPPVIKGTGYVVDSLTAALWAFYHSDSFAAGALLAVNLGDDADTTGAIYGQLAGTFYGIEGIPHVWQKRISCFSTIERLATELYHQPNSISSLIPVTLDDIIYDQVIKNAKKTYRLYLAEPNFGSEKPAFIFYAFADDGSLLNEETIILPSLNDTYAINLRLQRIGHKNTVLSKAVSDLQRNWKHWYRS